MFEHDKLYYGVLACVVLLGVGFFVGSIFGSTVYNEAIMRDAYQRGYAIKSMHGEYIWKCDVEEDTNGK